MNEALKIGEVAKRAGVGIDTVRFYERRGILPEPQRRASGYRIYTSAAIDRIRVTKSLQKLGFTLDELVEILIAFDEGQATCSGQLHRIEAVIERIDGKIAELSATRQHAVDARNRCLAGACEFRPEPGDGAER